MAGGRPRSPSATSKHASLREDYLNQVQRDFLSRAMRTHDAAPINTPSGHAARETRRELALCRDGRPAPVHSSALCGEATPSSRCSFGLVVVYCNGCARSGKTTLAAANAASVASWKPDTMSFLLPA